jgi:hypothetical protein
MSNVVWTQNRAGARGIGPGPLVTGAAGVASNVVVGDFNFDGLLDVYIMRAATTAETSVASTSLVFLNNVASPGSFLPPIELETYGQQAAVGEFDGGALRASRASSRRARWHVVHSIVSASCAASLPVIAAPPPARVGDSLPLHLSACAASDLDVAGCALLCRAAQTASSR